MTISHQWRLTAIVAATLFLTLAAAQAQSINGTVVDPTGAVVPNATVEIQNVVSHFDRSTTTDKTGSFSFPNLPFNPYHMTVSATGFNQTAQDVEVRSVVPLNVKVTLQVSGSTTTVNVEAEATDLLENDPTFHTDVDRNLFDKIPLESTTSELSSEVTLATPGIAADSNGLFHGLGDHAENSFSVDGQPITDQQSKVFSNQLPLDAVQSMEVVSGAPPAEFGGKTSIVIVATTRSGQGVTTPHGSVTGSWGTFGTSNVAAELAYGGNNWGNFISANGLNTGRFLDPPEFTVLHDRGNEENLFDRVDYQLNNKDSIHLDFQYTRSWFQTPNTIDDQNATPWSGLYGILPTIEDYNGIGPNGLPVGPADQLSKIQTFNIHPTWTHVLNTHTVASVEGWVRRDGYNYYPSSDPFSDLGPPSLQRQTVGQSRSLLNAGLGATLSYAKGINNVKGGVNYEQTLLNEDDTVGIVDPTYNAPCLTLDTNTADVAYYNTYVAVPGPTGVTSTTQCAALGYAPNDGTVAVAYPTLYPTFNPALLPYDLTRSGTPYNVQANAPYLTHTDIKETALYIEDTVNKGPFNFNLGLRGDIYNGLTDHGQAEPRLGAAYNIKKTNTVLRLSYAHTMESPFNENLILSSLGCANPVLAPLLLCSALVPNRLSPGIRNEYHAGFEQAFGRYVVVSGEYIWKYTHLGYDFSVLGDTPITFPIEWTKSKIPGYAGRLSVPNYHGFSALVVFSSVAARFFAPQLAGAGATVTAPAGVFRIDHDEKWAQTSHLQYQFPGKRAPWMGFNWRYDSGLVAGNTPCYGVTAYNDCPQSTTLANGQPAITMTDFVGNPLTADLEFEAGFACGGVKATPTTPLQPVCPANEFTSNLVNIPPPGTENDDHHPPRIQHRSLFDLAIGDDNLLRFDNDRYKVSLQLTAINLANKFALYNFLSTFSGTHYVSPRALTAEIGFHF